MAMAAERVAASMCSRIRDSLVWWRIGYKEVVSSLRIRPAKRIAGEIHASPDKSITHRALLLGSLAESESFIRNPLWAEDCRAMLQCLRNLGLRADVDGPGLRLSPRPIQSPDVSLDCGNSGTAMRLLAGAVASHHGVQATLMGDESLSQRPMRRVTEPLRQMGAEISGDTAPLTLIGRNLRGIEHDLTVASAQVKSALLIAGLRADRTTVVREPCQSRDHTERLLRSLGVGIRSAGGWTEVEPGPLPGFEIDIPGDFSSAAFWIVAATLLSDSELIVQGLGTNPTRSGLLQVVHVSLENEREALGEPIGDLVIQQPAKPKPFTIEGELVPLLIDEIPILAVLATQLQGTSFFKDAAELRVKESDRIAATVAFLTKMGACITATDDGMIIEGPTPLRGAVLDSQGDHRIAMSQVIAGLVAEQDSVVNDVDCIATSYPEFVKHLEKLVEY